MNITEIAAELGRRGGSAKVPKGLAMTSKKRRREIALMGVAKRRKLGQLPKRSTAK